MNKEKRIQAIQLKQTGLSYSSKFCEKHQMSYPPESSCYGCRTGQPPKVSPAPAGKSVVMRASRAAGESRPLDAPDNDARGAENDYSHSEGAHR